MRHGLAKKQENQLVDKLREGFFSFNINEATSSNLHKVLTLLDPTFSPVMEVKEVPQFGKN